MMGATRFRGGYEFDPETYAAGGGLPGMLWRAMQEQGMQGQGVSLGSEPNRASEYDSGNYDSPQGGLLGRLIASQAEQSQYQPVLEDRRSAPFARQNPDFRQLSRVSTGASMPMTSSFVASAEMPAPQPRSIQDEAGEAQHAREAAAARLARGARSVARAEGPPPDPVDIAKSAGIGLANGTINTAGLLLGDLPTGFGQLPTNFLPDLFRRVQGRPPHSPDEPDYFNSWRPDELRRWIENNHTGQFYQPKTRTGRYAETVAEFVPAILAGAGAGALWAGASRGAPAAVGALSELPGTVFKHAIAPGIVVQGLEDAHPESQAGSVLQKGYPAARRILPLALGAKRAFGL